MRYSFFLLLPNYLFRRSSFSRSISFALIAIAIIGTTSGCSAVAGRLIERKVAANAAREAADPANVEQSVRLINLSGSFLNPELEISDMDWYEDFLVLVPQYPDRFDNQLFYLKKADILDYLDGKIDGPLEPKPITINMDDVRRFIPRFGGFEAIAFDGVQAYITIETKQGGTALGYLVPGQLDFEQGSLTLDLVRTAEIRGQAPLSNTSDEAIVLVNDWVMTIYEANGALVNPTPVVHYYSSEMVPLGTAPFPNIEYRITAATDLDTDNRFWALNFFWPGDAYKLLPLDLDPLAEAYGRGWTHSRFPTVERLIELQVEQGQVSLTDNPPIQLELAGGLLGSDVARNWEGLVRLDDRGFLLATDKFPNTMLGFVARP